LNEKIGKEDENMEQSMKMRRFRRDLRKSLPLYVFLLPALIYIFIFEYLPMYGVQIAFRDYSVRKGIWGSDWVGLKHFINFFTFPNFKMLLKNTLVLSGYSLATFPLPIVFALMINEVQNMKFKKTIQMISYMPHFLSTVIICSMLRMFFATDGVVSNALELLGVAEKNYLTVPKAFSHLYVWSGVWSTIGWSSIIYIAALAGVPMELIEAAKIDGAGRMKVIWYINIPCIMPTVVILLILRCGKIMAVGFEKVFLLQTPLNLSVSQTISTYVYQIGVRGGEFSYSSAIGLFNNIVNIILLLSVNAIAKKVKGIGVV